MAACRCGHGPQAHRVDGCEACIRCDRHRPGQWGHLPERCGCNSYEAKEAG